jgi:hypothetical protein
MLPQNHVRAEAVVVLGRKMGRDSAGLYAADAVGASADVGEVALVNHISAPEHVAQKAANREVHSCLP